MNCESDSYEVIYCGDGDELRVFSEICDKLCIERYYKNHLKSGLLTNNSHKIQHTKDFK